MFLPVYDKDHKGFVIQELQLNLTMLLPDIEAEDECIHLLTERLAMARGVERAHIIHNNGSAELCRSAHGGLAVKLRLPVADAVATGAKQDSV